jgi:hypothetical protein
MGRIASLSAENLAAIVARDGKTKGANCQNTREAVRQLFGEDAFQQLVDRLPESSQALLRRKRILSVDWVPIADWAPFLEQVCDGVGRDEHRTHELARDWAERDFNGVYKFFIRFGAPEFILDRTAKVWSTYFSIGRLELVERSKTAQGARVRLELRDFVPWPMFVVNLGAFAEQVIVMTGKVPRVTCTDQKIEGDRMHADYLVEYE